MKKILILSLFFLSFAADAMDNDSIKNLLLPEPEITCDNILLINEVTYNALKQQFDAVEGLVKDLQNTFLKRTPILEKTPILSSNVDIANLKIFLAERVFRHCIDWAASLDDNTRLNPTKASAILHEFVEYQQNDLYKKLSTFFPSPTQPHTSQEIQPASQPDQIQESPIAPQPSPAKRRREDDSQLSPQKQQEIKKHSAMLLQELWCKSNQKFYSDRMTDDFLYVTLLQVSWTSLRDSSIKESVYETTYYILKQQLDKVPDLLINARVEEQARTNAKTLSYLDIFKRIIKNMVMQKIFEHCISWAQLSDENMRLNHKKAHKILQWFYKKKDDLPYKSEFDYKTVRLLKEFEGLFKFKTQSQALQQQAQPILQLNEAQRRPIIPKPVQQQPQQSVSQHKHKNNKTPTYYDPAYYPVPSSTTQSHLLTLEGPPLQTHLNLFQQLQKK